MSSTPDATIDLQALQIQARQQIQSRRLSPEIWQQIEQLPAESLRGYPWLLVYAGRRLCRQQSRFHDADPYVRLALDGFRALGDSEGEQWAMAEWLVLRYHHREFAAGLAVIDTLLNRTSRPYLQAEYLFGRFLCLIGLSHAAEAVAAGHASLEALAAEPDLWLQRIGRIQMLRNLAAGYYYTGAMRNAVAAAEEAAALAREHAETADMEPWCAYELGLALWRKGDFARARAELDQARRLAERWKHQQLWYWVVSAQAGLLLDLGRIDDAWEHFEAARHWGEDDYGPLLIQLRQDRLLEARWGCQLMLDSLSFSASHGMRADVEMLLMLIDLKEGRVEAALARLDRIRPIYERQSYHYRLLSVQLYHAAALLALGRIEEAEQQAAPALEFAAREQIYRFEWTLPDLLAPVLQQALRRGIVKAYVGELIVRLLPARRGLDPAQIHPLLLEMEIARRTQLNLLPARPPLMPDLEIAGASLPAEEVGGDFYGYYPYGANPEEAALRKLGVAVGDISGKGLPAALLLSGTVVALSTIVATHPPPHQVAQQMHAALEPYTSRNRLNIALCYTELLQQPQYWRLRTVSAGAIPPLVRRANGQIEWIEAGGLPLGTLRSETYREAQAQLFPGDVLLLLSDGLPEAMDAERRLFGFEQLEATLAAAPYQASAEELLQHMLSAVQAHVGTVPPHDDMTLVAIRVLAGSAGGDGEPEI